MCRDTATTEIYTLSLHDALPIFTPVESEARALMAGQDVTLQTLASFLGKVSGLEECVVAATEHCQYLQENLSTGLRNSMIYQTTWAPDTDVMKELLWWSNEARKCNGKSFDVSEVTTEV